jgi:hypothetical protein
MSSGDFVPVLEGFPGAAAGLSASVITLLMVQWQAQREAFMARSLADRDYVHVWADDADDSGAWANGGTVERSAAGLL